MVDGPFGLLRVGLSEGFHLQLKESRYFNMLVYYFWLVTKLSVIILPIKKNEYVCAVIPT